MTRTLLVVFGLLSSVAGLVSCGSRSNLWPGLEGSERSEPGKSVNAETSDAEEDPDGVLDLPDWGPFLLDCSNIRLDYSSEPATVLLLVDRSGSMDLDFGGTSRWSVVREALFHDELGLVSQLGDSARFGLSFYTSLDGFAGGTCPMMDASPLVQGRVDLLRATFDATAPLRDGDTPTGEALDAAVGELAADGAPGPHYLVLITDGEPDTCAVPDPQNGQAQALAAAERAFAAGITTYVVGVSPDIGGDHLQQMANVAQGVDPDAVWGEDPDAALPIVASEQHEVLAGQIKGALGDVRSCAMTLGNDVDLAGEFAITLDGEPLIPGTDYTVEEQALLLTGAACDRVLSDAKLLEAIVPCREREAP